MALTSADFEQIDDWYLYDLLHTIGITVNLNLPLSQNITTLTSVDFASNVLANADLQIKLSSAPLNNKKIISANLIFSLYPKCIWQIVYSN